MGIARGQITITNVNDGVSTYTKQVFKRSLNQPETPSGITPSGWENTPPAMTSGFSHNISSGVYAGWKKLTSDDDDFEYDTISFVTTEPNEEVIIKIASSSELNYDFIYVSDLDAQGISMVEYEDIADDRKASGNNEVKEVVTTVPNAGMHTLYVVFQKDDDTDEYDNCGYYKVIKANDRIWVSVAVVKDNVLQGSWSAPIIYNGSNGSNGEKGDDAFNLVTIPNAIIINQNEDKSFPLPFDVKFEVYKGETKQTVTNVAVNGTPIGITLEKKSGVNDTLQIKTLSKINDVYPREYTFDAKVYVGSKYYTTSVNVYIELIGEITTSIKAGVETTVAQKLGFKAEGSNVYSIEAAGNFIRSAEEHTTQLDKYVKGRNLIPNVLTASGWSNVAVLDGGGIYRTGSAYARTPRFKVNNNTGHVLSFYEMVAKPLGIVTITIYYYRDSSTTTEYSHTSTYTSLYTQITDNNDTTYVRKYKTITTPDVSGSLYAEIAISTISTAKPIFMLQLEEGSTPTPFDAETKDVGSIVKQTAENIEMKVGRCGLNIDEESITASGGKFKMQDDSGHTTFELDENGNLVSKGDAAFSGTVRAKNFFHNSCIFLEGNSSSNPEQYSYYKYYCYRSVTIDDKTYEVGAYYEPDEIESIDGYSYAFQKCTYDADVITMICNASPDGSSNWNTVMLPDPKDFIGKVIEVYGFNTGSNTGNHNVGCAKYNVDTTYYAFVKAISNTNSTSIQKEGSGKKYDTIAHDSMAKYISIYANGDNKYYWLKLI